MRTCPKFFLDIKREDLCEKLTLSSPWVYYSMELGIDGLRFAGGLGILAGDIAAQCSKMNVPFWGVTLFYPVCSTQTFEGKFSPQDTSLCIFDPKQIGFEKCDEVLVYANQDEIKLDVYKKSRGSSSILALSEPGLGELYQGEKESDHRLYQEVVLGFAGHAALKAAGVAPAILHLNEAATVFAALAELDSVCKESDDLNEAIDKVRAKTVFTNHTLVAAAVAVFSRNQVERFVYGNLQSNKVKSFLDMLLQEGGDKLNLSSLAITLSGNVNSVSKLHGRIATGQFYSSDGSLVDFKPVTNGIFLDRWVSDEILDIYHGNSVLDDYDLPKKGFEKIISGLEQQRLVDAKDAARGRLRAYLRDSRLDNYGNKVDIGDEVKIVSWARRLVDYKRPKMMFDKPDKLAEVLERHNMYVLISGKSHPGDEAMRDEIRHILSTSYNAPILEKRVHYLQDYDEELALMLVSGSDVWLNTPIVGMEACGTSIWKAMVNMTILISTIDGGAADIEPPEYIAIKGDFMREEVESLYDGLNRAGEILKDKDKWNEFVKRQLVTYLPIMSGGRMVREYIEMVLPKGGEKDEIG